MVKRFIPDEEREAGDQSTHKWMVYVRGVSEVSTYFMDSQTILFILLLLKLCLYWPLLQL
jgi:hypothetical protein